MRQIFSVRFFAAVAAVAALLFLLSTIFATRAVIDDAPGSDGTPAPQQRTIDLVARLERASRPAVALDVDGYTVTDTQLIIDASRQVSLIAGTPGEVHCARLAEPGGCALVADLLGEAVVWFALVPMGTSPTVVPLPAIDVLDGGSARLVNGWRFGHAPVLDRRCTDAAGNEEEFDSYREFRDVFGDDFMTLLDLELQRLAAVVCRTKVPYAPVLAAD